MLRSCVTTSLNRLQSVRINPFSRNVSDAPIQMSYTSYEQQSDSSKQMAPLVIMHGLFGSKSNWNSLCKVFQKKTNPPRRVVAVDARNHGDSPHTLTHNYNVLSADLRLLISDELKVDKAALLGHSMGGRAVMNLALNFPNFVDKLIVVDISPVRNSPNLNSMPELFKIMKNLNLPRKVTMSEARKICDIQLENVIGDKGLRAFLLTNLVQKGDEEYAWRINIDGLHSNFMEICTFTVKEGSKFEGPTLFIGGENSDFIKREDHTQIRKLFPNCDIKYVENAGHWLHSERPDRFLQLALEFINSK